MTTHECPGRCGLQVPRYLYACLECWHRLPRRLRVPITDNYRLDHIAHAAAMDAAAEWYHANPPREVSTS